MIQCNIFIIIVFNEHLHELWLHLYTRYNN